MLLLYICMYIYIYIYIGHAMQQRVKTTNRVVIIIILIYWIFSQNQCTKNSFISNYLLFFFSKMHNFFLLFLAHTILYLGLSIKKSLVIQKKVLVANEVL